MGFTETCAHAFIPKNNSIIMTSTVPYTTSERSLSGTQNITQSQASQHYSVRMFVLSGELDSRESRRSREGGIRKVCRREEDLGQARQMLPLSPRGDSADYPALPEPNQCMPFFLSFLKYIYFALHYS